MTLLGSSLNHCVFSFVQVNSDGSLMPYPNISQNSADLWPAPQGLYRSKGRRQEPQRLDRRSAGWNHRPRPCTYCGTSIICVDFQL